MPQILNPNPLARYFRKPAIYIRLPSNGDYWPPGALVMPENGELPVYPMTAADEITYRTPDALFNGQATVDVIQSCVPAIRNAWGMPAMDTYSILVSLRIASYGHDMDMTTTCPSCNTQQDFAIDLRTVLTTIDRPDFSQPVNLDEVEIYFRPMSYRDQNDISMMQFENNKLVEQITQTDIADPDKMTQMAIVLRRLTDLQMKTVLHSTAAIKIPDATITDRAHIEEYYKNCDTRAFTELRNRQLDHKGKGNPKPVHISCDSCKHEYDQAIEFDQSLFFASAS
jgi:hypothetical protein